MDGYLRLVVMVWLYGIDSNYLIPNKTPLQYDCSKESRNSIYPGSAPGVNKIVLRTDSPALSFRCLDIYRYSQCKFHMYAGLNKMYKGLNMVAAAGLC